MSKNYTIEGTLRSWSIKSGQVTINPIELWRGTKPPSDETKAQIGARAIMDYPNMIFPVDDVAEDGGLILDPQFIEIDNDIKIKGVKIRNGVALRSTTIEILPLVQSKEA